jgi:hypothetical protein
MRNFYKMLCWFPGNQTTQNSDSTVAKLPNDPLNASSARIPTHLSFVRRLVLTCLVIFLSIVTNAQTQTVILTSGSSWTVPSNVYSITVECWGGGGGGSNTATAGQTGGGGGGGAYAKKNSIVVTPGSSFSYSIGGGGGGSSAGGDTWFSSISTVLAKGGSGGTNNSTTGGSGGAALSSVGDVKYDGGKGGNGTGNGCCQGAGAGGGGAGSTGNGNAGPNGSSDGSFFCTSGYDVLGGAEKLDYGGDGGTGVGYDGNGGSAYGYAAGGGGAKTSCALGTNRTGGSGKQGLIRITYCYSPSSTNAGSDVTICTGGSTTLSGSATGYSGTNQLLFQDFENTGWTITHTGTASARFFWTYGPVATANGNGNSGSPSLIFANGDNSTTASTTTITSPTFSTAGYSSLTLSFRHHYDDWDGTDNAYVEVYNGSSWVTVQTYITVQGTLASFATASINLNSYVGISNFAIRFRYTNNNDWYWLIDDISINGNIAPSVTYAWSPSTGLSATNIANPVASPTSTQTYTLTTSHNGCSVTTDNVVVTVRPAVSDAVFPQPSIEACADPSKPYAILSATTPTVGSGTWSIVSGDGTLSSTTANPTTITGLSAINGSTTVKWEVAYPVSPGPACPKSQSRTLSPVALALDNVSLQSTGSPQYYTCRTCSIKDGKTYAYFDNSGKIIATIEDPSGSGIEMGTTEVCVGYDYNTTGSPNGFVKTVTTSLGDQQPYLPRYWSIDPATKTGQSVTVTLYFTAAEYNALKANASTTAYAFNATSELAMTKYPNGSGGSFIAPGSVNGTNVPITIATYNSDYSVTFVVSSFSTFYIHPQLFPFAPLPVELVSFTGYNDKDKNVLNWATASELNSDRFEIEKSISGTEGWSYIGQQKAVGGTTLTSYTFYDNQPVVGNNYYRLKIIDIDGTVSYSKIINISFGETASNNFARVYPNPTSGNLNVEIQSTANFETNVIAYDLVGKKIYDQTTSIAKGLNTLQVDFSNFASGVYVLQFSDVTGNIRTTKFVKE